MSRLRPHAGERRRRPAGDGPQAYITPYGLVTPAQTCAMQTRRFMHEYGVSQEALAEIALASYAHAQRNPRAVRYGQPLTREQYHDSRWIVEPFHLFDCCQESDGAAAVVITSAERAVDLQRSPAYIKAVAQGMGERSGAAAFNEPDFPTAHYRLAGEELWARSGVGPGDVDVAQVYENFTGPVLTSLSEMGFAPPDGLEVAITPWGGRTSCGPVVFAVEDAKHLAPDYPAGGRRLCSGLSPAR